MIKTWQEKLCNIQKIHYSSHFRVFIRRPLLALLKSNILCPPLTLDSICFSFLALICFDWDRIFLTSKLPLQDRRRLSHPRGPPHIVLNAYPSSSYMRVLIVQPGARFFCRHRVSQPSRYSLGRKPLSGWSAGIPFEDANSLAQSRYPNRESWLTSRLPNCQVW